MGEAANVQLRSPEIVTGYVMILDIGADAHSVKHGSTWSALLRSRLQLLSKRTPPEWTIGTVEGFAMVEVNFATSSAILSGAEMFPPFFDRLVEHVRFRNPNALQPRLNPE
jgi:hypothetical protein